MREPQNEGIEVDELEEVTLSTAVNITQEIEVKLSRNEPKHIE